MEKNSNVWVLGTVVGRKDLTTPGGRLFQTRATVLDAVKRSKYFTVIPPRGAIYAFVGVKTENLPGFDDQKFALDLLERKHVLLAPGTSFNVPYRNHFRITLLPDEKTMGEVFGRMEELLEEYATAG